MDLFHNNRRTELLTVPWFFADASKSSVLMSTTEHAELVEVCGGPPAAPFVLPQAQDAHGAAV